MHHITKIKVTNFKSFDNIEIDLGKFNVLIGANSSGKSNFVSIFKFTKDISKGQSAYLLLAQKKVRNDIFLSNPPC